MGAPAQETSETSETVICEEALNGIIETPEPVTELAAERLTGLDEVDEEEDADE